MQRETSLPAASSRRRWVRRMILAAFGLGLAASLWFGWGWMQWRSTRSRALELSQSAAFEQAEPLLRKALRHRPNDAEVVEALARGYQEANDPQAGVMLDRWVKLRPRDVVPLSRRMSYHARREDYFRAAADAERVLELDPDDAAALRELPVYAFGAEDYRRAERACHKSLHRRPSDRAARRLLAQSVRNQGRTGEAIKILEGLLSEKANDPAALVLLGQYYYESGEPKKAIAALRKALDDPQRWGTTRYYLALALKQDGQEAEANQLLAHVNKMREVDLLVSESKHYPTHVGLKVKAARACFEVGQDARAVELLTSAIETNPAATEAHQLLAQVYDKQGRKDLADRHRRLGAGGRP